MIICRMKIGHSNYSVVVKKDDIAKIFFSSQKDLIDKKNNEAKLTEMKKSLE